MTSKDIAKYRIEKDCLGNKLIPDDVYHGINTIRGYENFNISGEKN